MESRETGIALRQIQTFLEAGMKRDKGKAFELRALDALKRELQQNRLNLWPDACRVFHRKRYYSHDRGREIETDISIEIWQPDARTWSFVWVWQCKDYAGNIPVDDVEEFWAKLTQIGGVNVKAGLVTIAALQEGALAFARSKGIAVVRILPDDQIDQVLWDRVLDHERSPEEKREAQCAEVVRAITKQHFRGDRQEFFGLCGSEAAQDWASVIEIVLSNVPEIRDLAGAFVMTIDDVFRRPDHVITYGRVQLGRVRAGDRVTILAKESGHETSVSRIEILRQPVTEAVGGDHVCLVFSESPNPIIASGCIIVNSAATMYDCAFEGSYPSRRDQPM